MELGPIQKAWVKSLREHPERQTTGMLGRKHGNSYMACCLGELIITECRIKKRKFPFQTDILVDKSPTILFSSYERLGLISESGAARKLFGLSGDTQKFATLAAANDKGLTWPQ